MNEEAEEMPGSDAVRQLMLGHDFSLLVGWLTKRYPDASAHVEDAVVDSVVRFLAKRAAGDQIDNPAAWIRVAAKNRLINLLERQIGRETTDEGLVEHPTASCELGVEDKDVFAYLQALIERWPSSRLRVITLLYLEAGYEDEPLSQQDAAALASDILGEQVPWSSIGQTRRRGLERLRAEILAITDKTGINPVTGQETA